LTTSLENRAPGGAPAAEPGPAIRPWAILAVLVVAQLMIILDATVVNIALPSAQRDLGFSTGDRQWVVTAYSLAFGSLLLLGGKLSDLFGRKSTLIIGLIGFAVASAIGGAAQNFGMLITARAGQGVFGALLAPASLALLSTTFTDPKERARAFGVFGAVAGTGGAIGLLLGGFRTEYLSWRWCLYVNLIIAAVGVVGALLFVPRHLNAQRPRLDVPGTLAVVIGLVGLVYGLGHAESGGWSNGVTIGSLVVGALGLIAFALIEARVSAPLMPFRVILDRNRGGAYLGFLIAGAGMFAMFLFLTFFMSQSLGFSPVRTGVGFLPMIAVLILTTTGPGTRLLPRIGPKLMMSFGMATTAVGMVLLTRLHVGSGYAGGVLPALLVIGAGMAFIFAPAMNASTSGVRHEDAGVASALVNVGQQIGGSIGTALLSTLAVDASRNYLTGRTPTPAVLAEATLHSYTTAFTAAAVIFGLGAVVTGLLLQRGPLPQTDGDPVAVPA
jgi:EmrB/QacA subfamily drug resistance transporter